MRKETEEHDRMLAAGAYSAVAPPDEKRVDPPREEPVPYLNLAPLRNAVAHVKAAAERYAHARADAAAAPAEARDAADAVLQGCEQARRRKVGLPGRPWYRHFVYAPGLYTGYGVKTLPAVREAIEERQWERVDAEVTATAAALDAFAAQVDRAARAIAGTAPGD
jgi:N-acetylated-alpha-linked acidic dipeptidase